MYLYVISRRIDFEEFVHNEQYPHVLVVIGVSTDPFATLLEHQRERQSALSLIVASPVAAFSTGGTDAADPILATYNTYRFPGSAWAAIPRDSLDAIFDEFEAATLRTPNQTHPVYQPQR